MFYGRYPFRTVWDELDRLQRDVNRSNKSSAVDRMAPMYPAMNIWSNEEGAIVTAELPGYKTDDLDIAIANETLTLSGSRQPENVDEAAHFHRQERGYGKFSRTIQLPFPIHADKVEASYEKGILKIFLPRAESDKPRKIAVKSVS